MSDQPAAHTPRPLPIPARGGSCTGYPQPPWHDMNRRRPLVYHRKRRAQPLFKELNYFGGLSTRWAGVSAHSATTPRINKDQFTWNKAYAEQLRGKILLPFYWTAVQEAVSSQPTDGAIISVNKQHHNNGVITFYFLSSFHVHLNIPVRP